jgi:hypothetical protein
VPDENKRTKKKNNKYFYVKLLYISPPPGSLVIWIKISSVLILNSLAPKFLSADSYLLPSSNSVSTQILISGAPYYNYFIIQMIL